MDPLIDTMLSHTYIQQGKEILFEYTESDSFEHLTDHPVRQVRSVTYCDGKFVVVVNNRGEYGHPGGTLEEGESVAQALERELLEETSCKLIWWKPLGVQKVTELDTGKMYYQVRVVTEVEFAKFEGDPAEGIIACEHISLEEVAQKVDWKEIGIRLMEQSVEILKKMKKLIE